MTFVAFYANMVDGTIEPPVGGGQWTGATVANIKGTGSGEATKAQGFSPAWTAQCHARAPWLRSSDDKPLINVIGPGAILNNVRISFRIKKSNLSGTGDILPNFDESGIIEHWSFQAFDFTADGWETGVLAGTTFKNNQTVAILDGTYTDFTFGTDIGTVHNASYLNNLSLIRGDLAIACALFNAGSSGNTSTAHIDFIHLLVDFSNVPVRKVVAGHTPLSSRHWGFNYPRSSYPY